MNRDRYAQIRQQRPNITLDFHGKIIENKMKLYKINPLERPKYLGLLFEALKTIKPTSVEAEHAFSAMFFFAPKLRNLMGDKTYDGLISMHQSYKKSKQSEDFDSDNE